MARQYTVKQLAAIAGVTIKTLHLYDKMDLLKPMRRTEAGYRLYGDTELLRLQQILFYKELDFPLKQVADILDDSDFDIIQSLEGHRKLLENKTERFTTLLNTIDKTIYSLKNKTMLNAKELYEGLTADQAKAYRKEAINNYGEEVVEKAENHLLKLDKEELKKLVEKQKDLTKQLFMLLSENPKEGKVQKLIREHYHNTRKLWGTENAKDKQANTYRGLGMLYLTDERFTLVGNAHNKEFALFLQEAMSYFSDMNLS